jgi:hypothetical protein
MKWNRKAGFISLLKIIFYQYLAENSEKIVELQSLIWVTAIQAMYLFEYKPNMLSSYYICEKEKAVLD